MIIGRPKRWTEKPTFGATLDYGHPLTTGLVACYLFNEGIGTRLQNLAGTEQASFEGAPTWTARGGGDAGGQPGGDYGAWGPVLDFDGIDDAVNIGTSNLDSWTNGITVECIFSQDTLPSSSTSRALVSKQNDSGGSNARAFELDSVTTAGGTNRARVFINSGTGNDLVEITPGQNADCLYHYIAAWRPSDKRLVIRSGGGNSEAAITTDSSSINTGTNNTFIGRRELGGNPGFHDGKISLVRIWNRYLDDQIAFRELFESPYAMFAPQTPRHRMVFLAAGAVGNTRLYFSSALSAAASPAFDGGWNYTTEASRWRLKHVKGSSSMLDGTQIGAWADTAGTKALDRQYVSNPLSGAQTVGGNVKGQLLVQESTNTDNVDQIISAIKVVSNDGGTVRGTVLSLASRGPTAEYRFSGFRNKIIADGDLGSDVSALHGDRIVVELGHSNSTAGTTPEAISRWGEDATDLPENETEQSDGAGWIEFNRLLSFQADASTLSVGGTLTTAGNLIKQPNKMLTGILPTTGANSNKLSQAISVGGTLTTSGAAVVLKVFLAALAGTLTTAGSLATDFVRAVLAGGNLSLSGALKFAVSKNTGLAGTLTTSGSLKKLVGKALGAELTTSGAVANVHQFNLSTAGTLTTSGSLIKQAQKKLAGILTTAGFMARGLGRSFAGVLGLSGFLTVASATGQVGVCPLTAADLVARIRERLEDDNVYYTDSEVLHALDVIQRLFCWLTLCIERRAGFALSAGQTFYTPRNELQDYWIPLKLALQTGERLLPVTLDDLDKFDEDWQATSGVPRYYASMGFNFVAIYPQVSSPISIHFTYVAEPRSITAMGSVVDAPPDQMPLLVDGAIWWLRLKEGGAEQQTTLENLNRFVEGAKRYRSYVAARSKAQLYDLQPFELTNFDISRFLFKAQKEKRK